MTHGEDVAPVNPFAGKDISSWDRAIGEAMRVLGGALWTKRVHGGVMSMYITMYDVSKRVAGN